MLIQRQHSKDAHSPNVIYRFNAMPIKIPARFFIDTNKIILKCSLERKETRLNKMIMKKEKEGGRNHCTQFQDYLA